MKPVRLVLSRGGNPLSGWLLGHASQVRALAAVCLVAASASLADVGWQAWEARQQLASARLELAALQARQAASARRTPVAQSALNWQQSREWNQLIRQLNTPWPAMLDALEANTPEAVALVAIEPDPRQGAVRIQAEAKTLDTLLAYVENMKTAGAFAEVLLIKHETNERDPTRPMRLSVQARLRSPVPGQPPGAREPQ